MKINYVYIINISILLNCNINFVKSHIFNNRKKKSIKFEWFDCSGVSMNNFIPNFNKLIFQSILLGRRAPPLYHRSVRLNHMARGGESY